MRQKSIVSIETRPYLDLFALNKLWLDLKQKRNELIEKVREIRQEGYNLKLEPDVALCIISVITMQINEIEEQMSKEISIEKNRMIRKWGVENEKNKR